jgi:serine/threonine protein phosphatase PrpC
MENIIENIKENKILHGCAEFENDKILENHKSILVSNFTSISLNKFSIYTLFNGNMNNQMSNYFVQNYVQDVIIEGLKVSESTNEQIQLSFEEAVYKRFTDLDKKLFEKFNKEISNAENIIESPTALTCIISSEKIYLINFGASQAIHVNRQNKFKLKLKSNKQTNRMKLTRVGQWRILKNCNLQVLKCQPDILTYDRNLQQDKFLFIANDIFWNHMNNNEVIKYISDELDDTDNLKKICEGLINQAKLKLVLSRCDKMNLILIKLSDDDQVTLNRKEKLHKLQFIMKKFDNEFSIYGKNNGKIDYIVEDFKNELNELYSTINELRQFDKEYISSLKNSIINYELELKKNSDRITELKQNGKLNLNSRKNLSDLTRRQDG